MIRKTSSSNGHRHTYNDNDSGLTSKDDGHQHQYIVYINQLVPKDRKVVIQVADGHLHLPANANKSTDSIDDTSERKWMDVPFEFKQSKADDKFFTFSGYASTFGNRDLGGDIVVKGAFKKSLQRRMPKLINSHFTRQILGIFTKAFEDDIGLFVEGKMPKDHSLAKDKIIEVEIGAIDSMSIGYNIKESEIVGEDTLLKELDLWEASLVTFPMNEQARIIAMKSIIPFQDLPMADIEQGWDSVAAITRIKEFTGSEDSPNDEYRKAFLWFDIESSNKFSAYKLPIADIVNGKLMAVPKGIFAAANILKSSYLYAGIPDSAIPRIRRNVEQYYEKRGMLAPWNMSIEDIFEEIKSMKEVEDFLKGKGLSQTERKILISKVKHITGHRDGETIHRDDGIFTGDCLEEIGQIIDILKR